jgi:hypothetical protein
MANTWDRSGAHRDNADQFHAYPGYQLMAALREHAAVDDAAATLSRRITRALLIRSFRQNAGNWDAHKDGEDAGEPLHPAFTRADPRLRRGRRTEAGSRRCAGPSARSRHYSK